jgi:ethanolamine ammonia-lyase small subunit
VSGTPDLDVPDPDVPDPDVPGRPLPDGAGTGGPTGWVAARQRAAAVTPARLFLGSAGLAHRTADALALRVDHAFARDAVDAHLELTTGPLAPLQLPELRTRVADRAEHLLRPDLGRRLSDGARAALAEQGTPGADLQVVVGDGLSATAVHAQVPGILPLLHRLAGARGWSWGRPFAVRHCRVGVMNDIGDLLDPTIVVLLIGERPGLGTAESLSAYLAYRPRPGCTDADCNLGSNIHDRGTPVPEAAVRIVEFAAALMAAGRSGVGVKEPDPPPDRATPHRLPGG